MLKAIQAGLYNSFIRVKGSKADSEGLGNTLVLLLIFMIFSAAAIALVQIALGSSAFVRSIAIIFFGVLPAYVLARRGATQIAVNLLVISFTGFTVITAIADTKAHSNFSLMFDYTMPLIFMPVLAALLVRPVLALTSAVANCLIVAALYLVWEHVLPQLAHGIDTATGLFIPLLLQFMLGIICTLLADRLQRTRRHSDEQAELLNAILEGLPVGVAVFPPAERQPPIYHNPRFDEVTGNIISANPLAVKRTPHNIEEPENLAQQPVSDTEWPWQAAQNRRQYPESNANIAFPNGDALELHEETSLIYDENTRRLRYILYVATDVTKEQNLRERITHLLFDTNRQLERTQEVNKRLTELDRLKGEFLANVSHELRTPLGIILAHAEVLQVSRTAASPITKHVDSIYDAARNLRGLVDDILDAAKLDSNQLMLDLRLIDLRVLIQEAVKAISVLAEEKQLRLAMILPEQPALIMGDERRVQQIAWNLLSNAVKFTQRGTITIEVTIHAAEKSVCFSVQDTGIGIASTMQPFLFERFVQIIPAQGKRNGTGLGLSIARSLAQLHKGEVWLASSTPNQGSTFVCRLPLATIPTSSTIPTPSKTQPAPLAAPEAAPTTTPP